MVLTVDKLINDDRFCGENALQFVAYLPFGLVLLIVRVILALLLWIASIILPNKSTIRQMLSTLACWTFGVYVKSKGTRDLRCSVMVANYVSCLDSLAASHILGTISLRKWKVPPFFASTLGIKNAAQFVRKQHFAESPSKPVLLQPEGGPTNGRGLLQFTEYPFPIGNRVQPVAITVERLFTNVTVHRPSDRRDKFPWSDALWFLWSPVTVYQLQLLPPVERHDDEDAVMQDKIRDAIAEALQVETTEFKWEELNSSAGVGPPARAGGSSGAASVGMLGVAGAGAGAGAGGSSPGGGALTRLALQVREVLPRVPLADIQRDLAKTRSVDVTITNFLEGVTPYVPEPDPMSSTPTTSQPSTRYITPIPTGVFPKNAKERQVSFQEKKAQMIAEARQRYIEKHCLDN